MDVQVGTVDIHAIQLPATATYVNAVLVCAMVVYIVATLYSLKRQHTNHTPLLSGQMEL